MQVLISVAVLATMAILPVHSSYEPIKVLVEGPAGIVTDKGPAKLLEPYGYAAPAPVYAPAPIAYAAPAPAIVTYVAPPPPPPPPVIVKTLVAEPIAPSLLVAPGPKEGYPLSGVEVKGPGTVPATIAGPSGKIYAKGLWGPTLAVGKGPEVGGYGGYGKW